MFLNSHFVYTILMIYDVTENKTELYNVIQKKIIVKDKYRKNIVKEWRSPLEGRSGGVHEKVDGCTKTIVSLEEFRQSMSGALQGE